MNIGKEMLEIAVNFLNERYGSSEGGVAVLRIDSGEYLTSVWTDSENDSAFLCAETGAICEAHKINKKVTHTLCIVRENEDENYKVLPPCGICQERLFYFGHDVKCAVNIDNGKLIFKTLDELQPYYWLNNI